MPTTDTLPTPAERRNRAPVALSIVMPCYNEADQIEETLHSWADSLGEEYGHYEIIVVNDGSTDGTGRLLDRLRKEIPALRVIHQLNGGSEAAIRRAYEDSRGAYILQTESNGRFDPSDFVAFWERRHLHGLLIAKRTRPVESWLTRLHGKIVHEMVKFLFGAEWREPQVPFRLISRLCLSTQLALMPRGFGQVNLGLTLLAHAESAQAVGEIAVPFRFPGGMRRRPSLWALCGSLLHTAFELIHLRLSLFKLRVGTPAPAQAV